MLLDYLAVNSQCDPALLHARHFYVSQWYMETSRGSSDAMKKKPTDSKNDLSNDDSRSRDKRKMKKKKKSSSTSEESSSSSESDSEADQADEKPSKLEEASDHNIANSNQSTEMIEKKKKFLLTRISPFPEVAPGTRTQVLTTPLDGESAELITRFLASKRPFSQSFDSYLKHILKVHRLIYSEVSQLKVCIQTRFISQFNAFRMVYLTSWTLILISFIPISYPPGFWSSQLFDSILNNYYFLDFEGVNWTGGCSANESYEMSDSDSRFGPCRSGSNRHAAWCSSFLLRPEHFRPRGSCWFSREIHSVATRTHWQILSNVISAHPRYWCQCS